MANQSVLDYIHALAWPMVVSAALLYWRKPISGILKRISESKRGSAKVGPATFEWDDTLQEVNAVLTEAETKPELVARPPAKAPSEPDEPTQPKPPPDTALNGEAPDAPVIDDGQRHNRTLTPNQALNSRRQMLRELYWQRPEAARMGFLASSSLTQHGHASCPWSTSRPPLPW
jgi:hypothetical protein